jgi:hypothetical protein
MNRIRTLIIAATLLTLGASAARAQVESSRPLQAPNTVYVELGGKGLLYGVYYERLLVQRLGIAVGFSSWSISFFSSIDVTIIPVFLTWYPVGEEHHLYVDAGADFVTLSAEIGPFGTLKGSGTIPVLGTGYCFRSNTGGFYFKIGPMFLFGNGEVRGWANVTAGVTF